MVPPTLVASRLVQAPGCMEVAAVVLQDERVSDNTQLLYSSVQPLRLTRELPVTDLRTPCSSYARTSCLSVACLDTPQPKMKELVTGDEWKTG